MTNETLAFVLDTRLPEGATPSSGTVVAESGLFTLDTRLPDGISFTNGIVSTDSSPFTLDTQLIAPLPSLNTQTESPLFILDTRMTDLSPLFTNIWPITISPSFTLDTLSDWITNAAQTLSGGTLSIDTLLGRSMSGRVRFSPDGLRLTKADGNRVLLWNLQSSQSNVVFTGHTGEVSTLEFSPLGDQLLTGSADGTMRWWDTVSRAELGRTNPPGSGTVYAAYSSDGAHILAGRGAVAALYRVPGMEMIQEFSGTEGVITAVAVCPEGLALAGNTFRSAILWDTMSGAIRHRFTNHTHMITAASFLPGGTLAMTASMDGTIRVWDTATGKEKLVLQQGSPVADVALSTDGRFLISCERGIWIFAPPDFIGDKVYLWDTQSGALLRVFSDVNSSVRGVGISPDHTAVATSYADGSIRLWKTGLEPRPIHPITPLAVGTNVAVTLRSHGLYYFELNAEAGRSLLLTLEAATGGGGGPGLMAKGIKSAGNTTGISADARFANLDLPVAPNPRKQSLQNPPPGADLTAFRMTATKGHLPSVYDYESFAQASITNLHCEMPLATSTNGKVYVLVFAPYLAAGAINAQLRVEFADFHLSSIIPSRGGNGGTVTSELLGTGLTPDTTARLFSAGGASVAGQLSLWGDSTKAWFSFELTGVPTGNYSVEITRSGYVPAVLSNAFTVVAGTLGPQLQARLIAPSAVRPGRNYTLRLEYANTGDVDMAAPLFVVSAAHGKQWLFYNRIYYMLPVGGGSGRGGGRPSGPEIISVGDPAGWPRVPVLQVLGLNQNGPPGNLPPGSKFEMQIPFQGDASETLMGFKLEVLRPDATLIDWTALEQKLRLPSMSDDVWAALWANFKSTIGATWADYLRALNTQSHLLALAGQSTFDANVLLASLFSEAAGAAYRRTLFATVDASAPAPAVPLQFARFTTDGLEHRFSLGPLGRGWSHNYEYSLTQPSSGNIVVRTPGGGGRRFSVQGDMVIWMGETGDHGSIVRTSSGGFSLMEKDGLVREFDASGLLVNVEEPNHNRITLGYSGSQLTSLAHSAGPSFTLQYNGQGRLARLTDHAGQVTDYEYDPAGEHLLRVVSPGAVTNAYTYQPVTGTPSDHALTAISFPDGTHQFFSWNSMGRLAEQSRDGGAERLRFTYSSGGVVSVRDDRNAVTTLRLGERGQILQMTDALGHGVTFNYDSSYNLTRLTGPAGDTTEMTHDAQGNANRVINPLAQTVNLNHTGLSRLDTLRDARNQLTDFAYDSRGNLTSIAYPDTSAEQFGYDSAGSVTNWTNRRGQTIQFARNAQGQLIRKTYPNGRTIDYQHDARGLLTNVTDSAQGVTSLSYDSRGFLAAIAYPDGKGFTFEYNAAGRRTRRVGHDGYTLNYGYDAVGRLETLTDGASHELVRYAYDNAGRLMQETKGNDTFTTYKYDLAGQLVALTNHASLVKPLSFFNYTYDAKGNRLSMTTAAGVTSYGYDALNQLTGVTYPSGRRVTYAYDAAGNRTVVNDTGTNTAYAANALNQYTQAGGVTFGYDLDGNMTRRTDAIGTTTYDYDTENRLVRVATPTNGVFQYTYDALGNRTAVVHGGVTNRFLHDPVGLVDVAAEYDATGALVARYDHAIGLVSRTDGTGSAFYSFDALGNTRELTGAAGAVLNFYDYDAFGVATMANETVANRFQFVGRFGVVQDNAGCCLMRARTYSTILGRFLTPDPAGFSGGDVNLYRYARNNPVLYIDPSGFKIVTVSIFAGIFAVGTDTEGNLYLGAGFGASTPIAFRHSDSEFSLDLVNFGLSVSDEDARRGCYASAWGGLAGEHIEVYRGWSRSPGEQLKDDSRILDGITAFGASAGFFFLEPATVNFDPAQLIVSGSVGVPVVRPIDPNDKIGPNGVGPNRVVSAQDELEYMIRFENFASASAPVQELIVVDYLDAGLDWTTARFKEIAYGDRIVTPPVGSQSFTVRDQPPTNSPSLIGSAVGHMVIDVRGTVNPQTGRMEWRVTCLDTNTSTWPQDALSGFLPPENGTGRGQGYVKLGVRPKSNLPLGTAITNIASIVFDGNDPIATPPVWNIVGDVPSLAATIAYAPGQITAGMPFTYTIGLTNTGTNLVENVILTNALPSGVTVVNATATLGTVTVTNGTVIWNLGTVTNGVGGLLTITALPSQEGTFANTLYYSGGSGLAIYTAPSEITVIAATRPSLAIRLLGGDVELAWPTNTTGFQLQRVSPLSPAGIWESLTNSPATVGEEFRLQLSPRSNSEYYRLIKP